MDTSSSLTTTTTTTTAATKEHNYWMDFALEEANTALNEREVPVGCIFVVPTTSTSSSHTTGDATTDSTSSSSFQGTIIARGRNRTNQDYNATRHAELVAMDTYITEEEYTSSRRIQLQSSILYVTIEPCIMCAAALYDIGIKYVVYGAPNTKFGGCGSVLAVHNGSYLPFHSLSSSSSSSVEEDNRNNNYSTIYSSSSSSSTTVVSTVFSNEANTNTAVSGFSCTTGIRAKEAVDLLKRFYSRANIRAPVNQAEITTSTETNFTNGII